MEKFIYVFTTEAKARLLAKGFALLKEDIKNHIYVFENDRSLNFAECDVSYILSNTLSF